MQLPCTSYHTTSLHPLRSVILPTSRFMASDLLLYAATYSRYLTTISTLGLCYMVLPTPTFLP
eukprot:473226-Rhodomonas_salina.1